MPAVSRSIDRTQLLRPNVLLRLDVHVADVRAVLLVKRHHPWPERPTQLLDLLRQHAVGGQDPPAAPLKPSAPLGAVHLCRRDEHLVH
eukprot:7438219-Heterocapsa_arctica.AAC.1